MVLTTCNTIQSKSIQIVFECGSIAGNRQKVTTVRLNQKSQDILENNNGLEVQSNRKIEFNNLNKRDE